MGSEDARMTTTTIEITVIAHIMKEKASTQIEVVDNVQAHVDVINK